MSHRDCKTLLFSVLFLLYNAAFLSAFKYVHYVATFVCLDVAFEVGGP